MLKEQITEEMFPEININEITRKHPITILKEMVMKWPPYDMRLHENTHTVESNENPTMKRLMDYHTVKILKKISKENSIIVGIFIPGNLAELERYEEIVKQENSEWQENNCPTDVFNPQTGDVYSVSPIPALDAPLPQRRLFVRLRMSLEKKKDNYILSFAAWDNKNRLLYHNIIEHKNPYYLIRRSMQEMFGNHTIKGNSGRFLDGITFLTHGKKVKFCDPNKKPVWLTELNYKTKKDLEGIYSKIDGYEILQGITKYLIPLGGAFYGILWNLIYLFSYLAQPDITEDHVPRILIITALNITISTIIVWISIKISKKITKKLKKLYVQLRVL